MITKMAAKIIPEFGKACPAQLVRLELYRRSRISNEGSLCIGPASLAMKDEEMGHPNKR